MVLLHALTSPKVNPDLSASPEITSSAYDLDSINIANYVRGDEHSAYISAMTMSTLPHLEMSVTKPRSIVIILLKLPFHFHSQTNATNQSD